MVPQKLENLTVLPSRRHRAVRRLERSDGLRPLSHGAITLDLKILGRGRAAGWVGVRKFLLLSRPVVNVPVVLVEEEVVLVEEVRRKGGEVGGGKGREEEV